MQSRGGAACKRVRIQSMRIVCFTFLNRGGMLRPRHRAHPWPWPTPSERAQRQRIVSTLDCRAVEGDTNRLAGLWEVDIMRCDSSSLCLMAAIDGIYKGMTAARVERVLTVFHLIDRTGRPQDVMHNIDTMPHQSSLPAPNYPPCRCHQLRCYKEAW